MLPLCNLAFLSSGPHAWYSALLWTLPVWLCVIMDIRGPRVAEKVPPGWPDRAYTTLLYPLFALQFVNIGLFLNYAGQLSFGTLLAIGESAANIAALRILTGTTSCCSAIAVAHELIHRRPRHHRWMGRMLLWTVLYDHFAIEHVGGHHRRVGTTADPATARYGESFRQFWPRTLLGQFSGAWRLERSRLARRPGPVRFLRNRVMHGLAIQSGLLAAIFAVFGPMALVLFLYQAHAAVRLLETVNYFQHWGLTRRRRRFDGTAAWATDSWFSLHLFLGLSCHADHHEQPGKPYQHLHPGPTGPVLPYGYFAAALLVKFDDGRFHRLARRELERSTANP
ncbi:alkane 1-monooxygenase [Methylococcus sp. EFPC2]|uniref:alkane 1-monooxygenase n=1 Tax=Methylococcus sp. EFPC2 TaxID=2812648 RepID=UPI00196719E8|nr:alkane 1-monooxygenase [Methylococcus sp. EFPC2]QSA95617.1 alkane 1-monooxygenase [Methylococcus sp. EFPC2]